MSFPTDLGTIPGYRYSDWTWPITGVSANGTAVDYTAYGVTWTGQAKRTTYDAAPLTITIDSSLAVAGQITLSMPNALTKNAPDVMYFDIFATTVGGLRNPVFSGVINFFGNYTGT
ncbi:MAG: hypothetical protein M3O41_14270 [Pseudomonadota bacterium]|nr:hypothetical protein [Pseudomonadota bacterium]